MATPVDSVVRIGADDLRDIEELIFVAAGEDADNARVIADHLVSADLRGIGSHGVARTAIYAQRLTSGLVKARASITETNPTPISAVVDGDNGSGVVVARRAMDLAITKAEVSGIGAVAVRESNHCGMLAYYTAMAAQRGLIGLATTNAQANMAPWGSSARYFGTNPLSYALPTGAGRPEIVFDMATSQVAKGKILLAMRDDKPIPLGWALDTDGNETTDAHAAAAGTMQPVGGPKGSGLALLVDVLSALLSGAPFGPHLPPLYDNPHGPQHGGHFFLAMNPGLFAPQDEFTARLDQLADEIRSLPVARGHQRIYLPGEVEVEVAEARTRDGIPLPSSVRDEVVDTARTLGVSDSQLAPLR